MMDNIAALIVTFNPDIKRLEHNLKLIKAQIEKIIVVDNGSSNIDSLSSICKYDDIQLIQNGKNLGIASAQNKGFELLEKAGMKWVLTLDQDSLIPLNTVKKFQESQKMKQIDTGIIALSYFDRNWSDEQKKVFKNSDGKNVEEKDFVISSGNLVNVFAWNMVNGFDEELFIDMVDYDFDARLRLNGYKIWQLNDVYLNHEIGKVIHKPFLETLLLLPDKGRLADHSAFRQYYIYRNYIIFCKRYPMFIKKKFLILRTFISTRRIIVYKKPWDKMKNAWKGILDGARYNPRENKTFQKNIQSYKRRGKTSFGK